MFWMFAIRTASDWRRVLQRLDLVGLGMSDGNLFQDAQKSTEDVPVVLGRYTVEALCWEATVYSALCLHTGNV